MGPGSSKAEVDEAYFRGWQDGAACAVAWRDLCREAADERDVALRRVAELERRVYDQLEVPEGVRVEGFTRNGKRVLKVSGWPASNAFATILGALR